MKPSGLDFDFSDITSLNEDTPKSEPAATHRHRHTHSYVGPVLQQVNDSESYHSSPIYGLVATSRSFSHDASSPRGSEIGIAISSPWEDPQSTLPLRNTRKYLPHESCALDRSTSTLSASTDSYEDGLNDSRWRIIGGLLRKKSFSTISPYRRSARKSSKDSLHQDINHHQGGTRISPAPTIHEGIYTYRCPPEWEYSLPQPSDAVKPRSTPCRKSQFMNHGPLRKQSWRRTLSRRKIRNEGSRYDIAQSSTWPLSPVEHRDPEYPSKNSVILEDSLSRHTRGAPILQVEIPNIKLERFSIMFSSLLQPLPPPSLLTRRQGHLAELKLEKEPPLSSSPSS